MCHSQKNWINSQWTRRNKMSLACNDSIRDFFKDCTAVKVQLSISTTENFISGFSAPVSIMLAFWKRLQLSQNYSRTQPFTVERRHMRTYTYRNINHCDFLSVDWGTTWGQGLKTGSRGGEVGTGHMSHGKRERERAGWVYFGYFFWSLS